MSNINTGGPAFPCETIHPCGSHEQVDGLSIRDYFAAKAMQSVMPEVVKELQKTYISQEKSERLKQAASDACYGIADAMLKAREE